MRTSSKAPIDWLFPQVRKRILALLLTSSGQSLHLREIARRIGCAVGAARRELTGLTSAEIVHRVRDGNRTYYEANRASPLVPELTGLMTKTAGLADLVRAALTHLEKRIDLAFIYGSHATGKFTAASDVDVLVVGGMTFGQVVAALGQAQRQLGREINPTVYPGAEFRRKLAADHHFLTTVVKGKKIFLIGGQHELDRLAR